MSVCLEYSAIARRERKKKTLWSYGEEREIRVSQRDSPADHARSEEGINIYLPSYRFINLSPLSPNSSEEKNQNKRKKNQGTSHFLATLSKGHEGSRGERGRGGERVRGGRVEWGRERAQE